MLVILFGATGGVGSMLLPPLASRPGATLVTCGRKRASPAVPHYEWSFGSKPPIERIINEHAAGPLAVVYAPIAWPADDQAVESNIAALESVVGATPAEAILISISSLVVTTGATTFYAKLKRRAEVVCASHGGINLRLGMIDSARPFGQSLMFVKLARAFHVVPVPFPQSRVVLSEEGDLVSTLVRLVEGSPPRVEGTDAVEVRSASVTFIEAIRRLVRRQGVGCLFVPVPDSISLAMLQLCRRIAPRSWITQRLQGLQSFSTG